MGDAAAETMLQRCLSAILPHNRRHRCRSRTAAAPHPLRSRTANSRTRKPPAAHRRSHTHGSTTAVPHHLAAPRTTSDHGHGSTTAVPAVAPRKTQPHRGNATATSRKAPQPHRHRRAQRHYSNRTTLSYAAVPLRGNTNNSHAPAAPTAVPQQPHPSRIPFRDTLSGK